MKITSTLLNELVVLDFETTGLSPTRNRVIEVGAVILRNHEIVDSFSELMNPNQKIPGFISSLTGITNEMIKNKPSPESIMPQLKEFIGNRPIVAHNASFDKRFLEVEMKRAHLKVQNPTICTMLLSRRLIPDALNYQLGSLVKHLQIEARRTHRALDDVIVTTGVWNHLHHTVCSLTGIKNPDISIFQTISKKAKDSVNEYLASLTS